MLVTIMPFALIVGLAVFAMALAWVDYRAEQHDRAATHSPVVDANGDFQNGTS